MAMNLMVEDKELDVDFMTRQLVDFGHLEIKRVWRVDVERTCCQLTSQRESIMRGYIHLPLIVTPMGPLS